MHRVIQVGVGGYGRTWLNTVMAAGDRAQHVGIVDTEDAALAEARRLTGLSAGQCFGSIDDALDRVDTDIVLCVVPPATHEAVIVPALAAGKHVLSEKPIADTLAGTHRIVAAARASTGRFMVSQKGRFHRWVREFHAALETGEIGRLNHLTLHYRAPLFQWGASGFRHRMDDPLLVEMSIHHFDLIRALLGRNAVDVAGRSWNWPWSGFAGDVAASLVFTMDGGTPVTYEANCISAGDLTSWYGDIRAEGEAGTLTMVYPRLYVARRGANQTHVAGLRHDLAVVTDTDAGQSPAFAEFLDAIDQGRPPETSGDDNLHTMAMLFAAIDACRTGQRRSAAEYLNGATTR